jgi:hypothetical protein
MLLADLDASRRDIARYEDLQNPTNPHYGPAVPPNPADTNYAGVTITECDITEEFYSYYCRRGQVYFPHANDPVKYCPADLCHDQVVPDDAQNRKFVMITSSGTTNTFPVIVNDPNRPGYVYFGGHHHEAIGIRKGPPGEPDPDNNGQLKFRTERESGDQHDRRDGPSHPYHLRSTFNFDARLQDHYPVRLGGVGGVSNQNFFSYVIEYVFFFCLYLSFP